MSPYFTTPPAGAHVEFAVAVSYERRCIEAVYRIQ